jgi:1-acyl-sn-glycerol-3-phosphate acyltransferase
MLTVIVLIGVLVVYGLEGLLLALVYPLSKKLRSRLADFFTVSCPRMGVSLFKAYLHFQFIFDKENTDKLPQQFMIISNHQSLLDIYLFFYAMPEKRLRFVAKSELGHFVPLLSQVMRAQEHALIKREGNTAQTMRTLDAFADRVAERGQTPVIVPEGRRSRDGSLGAFAAAGFRRIISRQPMPVAVYAVEGGWKLATLKGIFQHLQNASYRIKILKIFPAPTSKQEQIAILEEGKALIQAQLDTWRNTNGRE